MMLPWLACVLSVCAMSRGAPARWPSVLGASGVRVIASSEQRAQVERPDRAEPAEVSVGELGLGRGMNATRRPGSRSSA